MSGLIQRLTGSDDDTTEEETDSLTPQETAELVLNEVLDGDFKPTEDSRTDWLVGSEAVQKIQKLAVYNEGMMDSRMSNFLARHSEYFNAHIAVIDVSEEEFETELKIEMRSIHYTSEELVNDVVGDFVRTFSYRGPDVRFDVEEEEPEMTVYSY